MIIDYGKIYCKGKNVNLNASQSYYEGGGRTLADLLDLIYPVGSVYINANNINPEEVFGGTWERISQGRFLIGVGAPVANNEPAFGDLNNSGYVFNANGMGGQYTHSLSVDEIPPHQHWIPAINWEAQSGSNTPVAGTTFHRDGATQLSAAAGQGSKHNNMPPYFGVYMWKRIA